MTVPTRVKGCHLTQISQKLPVMEIPMTENSAEMRDAVLLNAASAPHMLEAI